MFVMLGLFVSPSEWNIPDGGTIKDSIWFQGILLFLVLIVARFVAVFLGTIKMGVPLKNKIFISWAGLRGAVPIVLATYPLSYGMPIGETVFNLVFFVVLLSVLFQGSTLGVVAKLLHLSTPSRPAPRYDLEFFTMAKSDLEVFTIDLPDPQGCRGPKIRDLALPEDSLILMLVRSDHVLPPRGDTELRGWDRVTVLAHADCEQKVRDALLQPFEAAAWVEG
jgi:cell volume regulation protein A